MVIGHTDCGVQHINSDMMIKHMMDRGVDEEKIELIRHCGIDFDTWLEGFDCVESSVKDSVEMLRKHPLIPKDVKISGYVMDSVTGELHVVEPYNNCSIINERDKRYEKDMEDHDLMYDPLFFLCWMQQ